MACPWACFDSASFTPPLSKVGGIAYCPGPGHFPRSRSFASCGPLPKLKPLPLVSRALGPGAPYLPGPGQPLSRLFSRRMPDAIPTEGDFANLVFSGSTRPYLGPGMFGSGPLIGTLDSNLILLALGKVDRLLRLRSPMGNAQRGRPGRLPGMHRAT